MAIKIWTERKTAVVEPNGKHVFELSVGSEENGPLENAELTISITPTDGSTRDVRVEKTGANGLVPITVEAGSECGIITIEATMEGCPYGWIGKLYSTNVHIPHVEQVRLTEEVESLLRMLYWDRDTIQVLRKFGGGLSGNQVLQVETVRERTRFPTEVVKIGLRDGISEEAGNFEPLRSLGNAVPIRDHVEYGILGAIIYADAHADQTLGKVVPFGNFFENNEVEAIQESLFSVLQTGMRKLYVHNEVSPESFRGLIGRNLPEQIMLSLDSSIHSLGVYHSRNQVADSVDTSQALTPRDVETERFLNTGDTKPGDIIVLDGFRIGKVEGDQLNLEDAEKRKYKIKVHFDGYELRDFSAGDIVTVVAKFTVDRWSRMEFAVSDCLSRFEGESVPGGYRIEGERYPDILSLFRNDILDSHCDVAKGIIHGDLHWENVMIETPSNWRLIDYGLTGGGPVLFDFIKLEVYLRLQILATCDSLTPKQILAFEWDLIENPFGHLLPGETGNRTLDKAAAAIRTIRRLARPYLVDDFFDYWKYLFAYCVTLTKYYPTEDKWQAASVDDKKLSQCERASRATFMALAIALNIGRILPWSETGKNRKRWENARFEFASLGEVLKPAPGKFALDVGNRCEPGIIDHHTGKVDQNCAASVVLERPQLITDHLRDLAAEDVTWIVHEGPDFDCVASAFLAWHYQEQGFFPPGARQLTKYTGWVDEGGNFLDWVSFPERTPYALFLLHLREIDQKNFAPHEAHQQNQEKMFHGFEILDYLCRLEVNGQHAFDQNQVPHEHGFWKSLRGDKQIFETQDLILGEEFETEVPVNGRKTSVKGLKMEAPRSLFFKAWTRRAGFPLMIVLWGQPDKPDNRIVVSVPPSMKESLRGLGNHLEQKESEKRKSMEPQLLFTCDPATESEIVSGIIPIEFIEMLSRRGRTLSGNHTFEFMETHDRTWLLHTQDASFLIFGKDDGVEVFETKRRPPEPRWEGVDNNDPWYDGRGHDYTIVDSPRRGTVLSCEDVMEILQKGEWI